MLFIRYLQRKGNKDDTLFIVLIRHLSCQPNYSVMSTDKRHLIFSSAERSSKKGDKGDTFLLFSAVSF